MALRQPKNGTATVVYVRTDGSDANGGLYWANAKQTVQAAIDHAQAPGGEVWVAKGTYPGDQTIPAGLGLYGGFAGTETARDQRDPEANPTSFDLVPGGQGTITVIEGAGRDTVLDGFRLIGTARVICSGASPTITNNEFIGAMMGEHTGVYLSPTGSPYIGRNRFRSGSSSSASAIFGQGSPVIEDNHFVNASDNGAAIWVIGDVSLARNVFENCQGVNKGAVAILSGTFQFTNNEFINNVSRYGGAVVSLTGTGF